MQMTVREGTDISKSIAEQSMAKLKDMFRGNPRVAMLEPVLKPLIEAAAFEELDKAGRMGL